MGIDDARNIDGSKRFHPPGQHPAIARMRAQLAKAEELKADAEQKFVEYGVAYDTGDLDEFIAYLKQAMADFDGRESEIKADWLRRYGDR
jgi:hypothetical protein